MAEAEYRNPVSESIGDTFADPALIRGKDGWWYAYGTSDPLREGEGTVHRIPIARSRDLVRWTYVTDAFTDATLPGWAAADAGIWAPDIRYVDGEYRLYYVVTRTTLTSEVDDNAIGVATAPTPLGPWSDSGAPVVGPRRGGSGNANDFRWTFDPSVVTGNDGAQWLFYGSYYGGVFAQRLAGDGRARVGDPTMVAIDNKFEGAYPVRRGALLVPLLVHGELLRRTDHRLLGPGRPVPLDHRSVRGRSGRFVDHLTGRRDAGSHPERERLDRRRPQRDRHRPRRARTGSSTTPSIAPIRTSTAPTESTSGRC